MRPNRQELQGQIVAGPSFTPVDTFAAPPQRPVVTDAGLDLQPLIDISDTLRGVRAAEAKDEVAFEGELTKEFARRELEGESFGSIIKDLLGTEGTPNQTKAKLVRMQRDGRISATESPVFLSLVDDAKVELLTQRASEAVNRRATDIVKAGRAAAAQYAGTEDADLRVQEAIAAAVDEIIADEVGREGGRRSTAMRVELAGGSPMGEAGSETPGLGDRAARRLAGTLDSLAGDLEVKAYLMLQEEMEEDLLTSKTQVSATQSMAIVESLNGDDTHSFSVNERDPMRKQLQKDFMVYANSGKKDYHAAFEDGPIRMYVNAFKQIDDPAERQEALEGLMQIATELNGPGGVKPYSGATKRANRISTMISKEIERARRDATAEGEMAKAANVEQYVANKVPTELLLVEPEALSQEERIELFNIVKKAPDGERTAVARHIDNLRQFYKGLGPSTAATIDQEAEFETLMGQGGELSKYGETRADLQEVHERGPEALAATLMARYDLTVLQVAKITNRVRGFQREALGEAAKWQGTANSLLKAIEAGRPAVIDAEGSILEPSREGQVIYDRQFGIDLRQDMEQVTAQLEEQIENGEIDSLTAVRQFQAEVNNKITARQAEVESDNVILTDQEVLEVSRTQAANDRNTPGEILYNDNNRVPPSKPLEQLGVGLGDFAFSGGRRARMRRTLALGALQGFDNVEEQVVGDTAAALEAAGVTAEEAEKQATEFANNLLLEMLQGDFERRGLEQEVVFEGQAMTLAQEFEARYRDALGLNDLPSETGLFQGEREGIDFADDFANLRTRMAEASPLFSEEDGKLQIDYTRLPVTYLYKIDSSVVDDTFLFDTGLADRAIGFSAKRQFQDQYQYALKSLNQLNLTATQNIDDYRKDPYDPEPLARLARKSPVYDYIQNVSSQVFETKTGAPFNPNDKADRMKYGIVVAHVFNQLALLNQTIE